MSKKRIQIILAILSVLIVAMAPVFISRKSALGYALLSIDCMLAAVVIFLIIKLNKSTSG